MVFRASGIAMVLEQSREKPKKTILPRMGFDAGRGRPRIIPPELVPTLEAAGYKKPRGNHLPINHETYWTEACAAVRFSLLSADCQAVLCSPTTLQRIESTALSRLKSASRHKIKGQTFEQLVAEGILDYATESARTSGPSRINSLPPPQAEPKELQLE